MQNAVSRKSSANPSMNRPRISPARRCNPSNPVRYTKVVVRYSRIAGSGSSNRSRTPPLWTKARRSNPASRTAPIQQAARSLALMPLHLALLVTDAQATLDLFKRSFFDDTFAGIHQLAAFDYALIVPYFAILIMLSFY